MSYQLPVADTDLEEARAELLHFAAGMGKTGVEPSTATPSERESRPEHQDMDQDANREKRIEMDGERPPAKFAKGEAKGDQRLEEAPQTGKGSQAPTLGAANKSPTRELQTAQGSLSSGGDGSQLRKGSRQNDPARGTGRAPTGPSERTIATGTRAKSWRTSAFATSFLQWRG